MKRFALVLLLVLLAAALGGCTSYNQKADNFRDHLAFLATDPEDYIDFHVPYNRTEDLEDAFTKLYCYLYEEDGVTWNEADDAWIYVSRYIDALHAEIAALYEEYQSAY